MIEKAIQNYRETVDREIKAVENYITAGKCKDYPEYLAKCYEIHAYKRAKDNFNEEIKSFYDDDGDKDNE